MNATNREDTSAELDWKELEVMSFLALKKESHKREIIREIKQRFPNLRDKPNSSLYLIFERLQKKGLIKIRKIVGKGRKTFVTLTDLGKKQIMQGIQWSFQLIVPSLIQCLTSNIVAECRPFFTCTASSRIAFIGPSLILTADSFLKNFDFCLQHEDQRCYFLKMPYNKNNNISDCETISCTPEDIPIKDGYFHNVLSMFALSFLKDYEQRIIFLRELKRTLTSNGKLFLVELKQFRSFIYNVLSSFTNFFTMIFFNNSDKLYQFGSNELLALISEVFPKASVLPIDYAEFIFVKIQL